MDDNSYIKYFPIPRLPRVLHTEFELYNLECVFILFKLRIQKTTAVGESILTQTICKASIRQHQTPAFSVPATLLFLLDGWKAFYAKVEKFGQ
jgi:hypothetical protein